MRAQGAASSVSSQTGQERSSPLQKAPTLMSRGLRHVLVGHRTRTWDLTWAL